MSARDACPADWWPLFRQCHAHSPNQKLVAAFLASYADFADGSNAHPGRERLADETGLSVRSVERHLSTLVRDGWIRRTAQGGGRGGSPRHAADAYQLVVPARHL